MSPKNEERRQGEVVWEQMKRESPDETLEKLCGVLARRDEDNASIRAMSAVLFRTLFGVRSDVWYRVQPTTQSGG
ncbi:unnamed protein product, partial [Choristocarpus tenellus]